MLTVNNLVHLTSSLASPVVIVDLQDVISGGLVPVGLQRHSGREDAGAQKE